MPKPEWAIPRRVNKRWICDLSERRNALVHDGMYGGEPTGFAHPKEHQSMELELRGLVARLLLSLLGIRNEYTSSPCTTRQTIGFSFSTIPDWTI